MPHDNDSNKKSTVDYTGRDFDSIRQNLIEFVKRYYPDTFQDFNEAGFGMTMVDSVSYIGDMLSFYLDYEANEAFLETASEYENVINLAKQQGYDFNPNPSARGEISLYIEVPANAIQNAPDPDFYPVLRKGTQFASNGGAKYTLAEDVDFSVDKEVVVGKRDESTGLPNTYVIKKKATVVSGEIIEEDIRVGSFERFRRVELSDPNVSKVISVKDLAGHRYYQVPNLAQDYVLKAISNNSSNSRQAPNKIEKISVPRRFVLDRNRNFAHLQFGYGSEQEEGVVEPDRVAIDRIGRDFVSDTSFDPTRAMNADTLGIAPANTVLTVRYRANNVQSINAATGEVSNVAAPIFKFDNPSALPNRERRNVEDSLEVKNERPITGDVSLPTPEEIRRRARATNTAQDRAVTAMDYETMVYSMPSKFGAVKRCNAVADKDSLKRNVNIYVVSENADSSLTRANNDLKQNIKEWISKKKPINDTIDIHDAFIVNFGIDFTIVAEPDHDKYTALQRTIVRLQREFGTHLDIGEDIHITKIYNIINEVEGVADAVDVSVRRKTGAGYANTKYELQNNKTPDGRFIHAPKNIVFEVKRPESDIDGKVK